MYDFDDMSLYLRNCHECSSVLDLSKDKFFIKPKSKFISILDIVVNTIIFTTPIRIAEDKLICESCNRDLKLKKVLK